MDPNGPPCEVRMLFEDGEETTLVTLVGPNLYRMEDSSVLWEPGYHDVVEAESQTDGTLKFLRVQTPSGLTTLSYILSPSLLESRAMSVFLEKVMAVGGNWESIFGGVLILHVSPVQQDFIKGEFSNLFHKLPRNNSGS